MCNTFKGIWLCVPVTLGFKVQNVMGCCAFSLQGSSTQVMWFTGCSQPPSTSLLWWPTLTPVSPETLLSFTSIMVTSKYLKSRYVTQNSFCTVCVPDFHVLALTETGASVTCGGRHPSCPSSLPDPSAAATDRVKLIRSELNWQLIDSQPTGSSPRCLSAGVPPIRQEAVIADICPVVKQRCVYSHARMHLKRLTAIRWLEFNMFSSFKICNICVLQDATLWSVILNFDSAQLWSSGQF